jgi:AraC-like DNA-binding protein
LDKYRESLRLERASIIVSRDAAPDSFPPHWHSEMEVIAPLQNNYEIEINSVAYQLGENDIIIVFPCEIHSIKSAENKNSLVFQFSISPLTFIYEFRANFQLISSFHIYRQTDYPELLPKLLRLLMDVAKFESSGVMFKEIHMWSSLMTFFGEIGHLAMEKARVPISEDVNAREYSERMYAVCFYLYENYAQPISLDFIASFAGFSKYHFSRVFKKYIGLSFSEFLTNVRLRNIEKLLADNSVNIADAAMSAGFGSLSAFNRVFKQYKGCSPSDFRKINSRIKRATNG